MRSYIQYMVPLPNIFLTRLSSKTRLKKKDFQAIERPTWAQEPPFKSGRPRVFFSAKPSTVSCGLALSLGFELGESDCESLVHDFIFFDALAPPTSDREADLEIGIVV